MAIVTMPAQTAQRLKDKILNLSQSVEAKVFFAKDTALGLGFTEEEIKAFGGETGDAVVLAVWDLDALKQAIPQSAGGRLNYIPIVNEKAKAKLDPFYQA
ncbi:hypothetical protein J7394_03525 [Ruegeria sp. R13_0]|uniref:hypothetical protein n=1 Tax=Ruegeria sp. R13_0 TaxID=2821099 RepID=UPI001ADCAD6F|nr:hypothetical protein [Ruegeria sp. R13_0]MBO9433260.1 hypothetical protein [Ruegeria sp. R13_0]